MDNAFSYLLGISVAAAVVGGMIFAFYLSSDAYAAQVLDREIDSMSVEDLKEIVYPMRSGFVPGDGPDKTKTLAALIQLGADTNDIDQRVDLLAISQEHVHTEFGAAAKSGLLNLGDKALPKLRSMLEGDDLEAYCRACSAINLMGQSAKELVPDLVEFAKTDDQLVSAMALFAFENMGKLAEPIIPDMNETLLSREFHGQIYICKICIGLGRDAAPMAKNLAELYQRGIVSARSWAGVALGAIGPVEDVDTVELLKTRMNAFTQIDKERAFMGLALMGPEADAAKEDVYAVMMDEKSRVRPHAAYAYYRITDDAQTASSVLGTLVSGEAERTAALLQLEKMGAAGAAAIPSVLPLLKSPSVGDREAAVITLGRFGPEAAGSRLQVSQLSNDPDPLLRQAVKDALDAIDGKTPNVDESEMHPSP